MRLLHTSDWHLGRMLHGVDLLGYHQRYCEHLIEQVREREVDALLVAGDVYDRAVPPVEAVSLLSETLTRLAELCRVIVIPGNHDSAVRLGFLRTALNPSLRVVSSLSEVGLPVEVGEGAARTLVYPIPYLDPDIARRELTAPAAAAASTEALSIGAGRADTLPDTGSASRTGEPFEIARSHQAVMDAAMARVRADAARRTAAAPARLVVMAHAFVTGSSPSDSERDIRVGGVDSLSVETFAGMDYVALGHLHGPQRLRGPGTTEVRYSGSPLPFSFSEAGQRKSSVLVELDATGPVLTELIPAPVAREVVVLRAPLAELLGPLAEGHEDDWVMAVATDPVRPAQLWDRVKSRLPHALVVRHEPSETQTRADVRLVQPGHDPLEVAADFVAYVTGGPPGPEELEVLRASLEVVSRAEMSA